MVTLTGALRDEAQPTLQTYAHVRRGRPPRRPPATTTYERYTRYGPTPTLGSHMPLDTEAHWDWRNPLNLIPASLTLLAVFALCMWLVS